MTLQDYFIKDVQNLLAKKGKVLAFVRIPNSGNNRHYFFIENNSQLNDLIKKSKTSDSITIFKEISILDSGIVTSKFILRNIEHLSSYNFNPEIIIVNDTYSEYTNKQYSEWDYADSISELESILNDSIGKFITIIHEPDFCDESNTFHLYVPDKNGISKSGYSY